MRLTAKQRQQVNVVASIIAGAIAMLGGLACTGHWEGKASGCLPGIGCGEVKGGGQIGPSTGDSVGESKGE